jgi:hypothetical protein
MNAHGERLRAGSSVGSYTVISVLGSGAGGTVHRARDTRLDRDVRGGRVVSAPPH